jgi:hypothetical protein
MKHAHQYELLVQHQSTHGPTLIQVRGSLIVSSLQTLRELGWFDDYLACLPAEQHEHVLYVLAASWVPVELAMAHYGACEAMQRSDTELDAIGRHVSERILSTFLGTLVRTSRLVVAPGRVPLLQYPRLWDRILMGGGCSVSAMGPKDARIESRGVPMFRYRYFRVAYVGLIRGAGLMFRSAVHVRIHKATDDSLTIDMSWV